MVGVEDFILQGEDPFLHLLQVEQVVDEGLHERNLREDYFAEFYAFCPLRRVCREQVPEELQEEENGEERSSQLVTDRRCVALSLLAGVISLIAFFVVDILFDLTSAIPHVDRRCLLAVIGDLLDCEGDEPVQKEA